MLELLNAIKDVFVTVMTGAIVTILAACGTAFKDFIDAKIAEVKASTENSNKAAIMDALEKVCRDVSASFDPVAEKLKKASDDGKLTEDEIEELKDDAFAAAMMTLSGIFSLETINAAGIDKDTIEDMIKAAIEASLQRRKKGQEKDE